jgi:hypothetical protein
MRSYKPTGRPRGRPKRLDFEGIARGEYLVVPKDEVDLYALQRMVTRENLRWQALAGGPQFMRERNYLLDDSYHPTNYTIWRTR